jgi:hypothetical protein
MSASGYSFPMRGVTVFQNSVELVVDNMVHVLRPTKWHIVKWLVMC